MTSGGPDRERAAAIIHELNNALGLVINYATLVAEDVKDQPQVTADLAEIRNAGQRAADLVRELSAALREGSP